MSDHCRWRQRASVLAVAAAAAASAPAPASGQQADAGNGGNGDDAVAIVRDCIRGVEEREEQLARLPRRQPPPASPWRSMVEKAVAARVRERSASKECVVKAVLSDDGEVTVSGPTRDPQETLRQVQSALAEFSELKVADGGLVKSPCVPEPGYAFGNSFKYPLGADGQPLELDVKDVRGRWSSRYDDFAGGDECQAAGDETRRLFQGRFRRLWVTAPRDGDAPTLRLCVKGGDDKWVRSGDTAHDKGVLVLRHGRN